MTQKFIVSDWDPDMVAKLVALPYTTERGDTYPDTDLSTPEKVRAVIDEELFLDLQRSLGNLAVARADSARGNLVNGDGMRIAAANMLWSILKLASVNGMSAECLQRLDFRNGFFDPPYTAKSFPAVDLSTPEKVYLYGSHRIVIRLTQQMGRLSWVQIRYSDGGVVSRRLSHEVAIVLNAMYALTHRFMNDVLMMLDEDIADTLSLIRRES